MAAIGLSSADFEGDDFEVWPDCWAAVTFFNALGPGCWQVGGPKGCPYGLRNESFREVRAALGIKRADWPAIFDDVCVMEIAALQKMKELRER